MANSMGTQLLNSTTKRMPMSTSVNHPCQPCQSAVPGKVMFCGCSVAARARVSFYGAHRVWRRWWSAALRRAGASMAAGAAATGSAHHFATTPAPYVQPTYLTNHRAPVSRRVYLECEACARFPPSVVVAPVLLVWWRREFLAERSPRSRGKFPAQSPCSPAPAAAMEVGRRRTSPDSGDRGPKGPNGSERRSCDGVALRDRGQGSLNFKKKTVLEDQAADAKGQPIATVRRRARL